MKGLFIIFKSKVFWAFLSSVFPVLVIAQSGSIHGKVLDNQSQNPVEYATIALLRQIDSTIVTGTITGVDGTFTIQGVDSGFYNASVQSIGYQTKVIDNIRISKSADKISLPDIYLSKSFYSLDGVNIVAETAPVEYKIDKKIVNVSKQLNASGGNATDALKNIPSIETTLDGDIKLRGSSNFTLLIDGKPTVIDASDMLDQIPSSTIRQIEIITNPSAKYDPDGTAGIINVILKKEKLKGVSGIVNLSGGNGHQYSGDASVSYRGNKYAISGGIEMIENNITSSEISERETYRDDTTVFLSGYDKGNRFNKKKSIKSNFDYSLTKRNTLTFSGNYSLLSFGHETNSNNHQWTNFNNIGNYITSEDNFDINPKILELSLGDEQFFDSSGLHKLSFNLFSIHGNIANNEQLDEYISNSDFTNQLSIYDKTLRNTKENIRLYDIDLDYEKPLGEKGKLEAGFQMKTFSSSNNYNVFSYDDATIKPVWDSLQSNSVKFSRTIIAGYSSASYSLGKWEVKAGIRLEYINQLLEQQTLEAEYEYKKPDVFPSIYLSRSLPFDQHLQISYSRRINRPQIQLLNPYTFFSDGFTEMKGNPNLKPDYTNSFELNYQKNFGTSYLSIEAYYRQTNEKITRIQEVNNEGILVRTMTNLDKDYTAGIEIMGDIKPLKWLDFTPRFTWYKYRLEGNYNAVDVIKDSKNWLAGVSSSIRIKSNTSVQLTINYESPTVTLDGNRDGFFYTGAAVSQYLLNRKATLSLRGEDIFDTRRMKFSSHSDSFYQSSETYITAPQIVFSFTYRFNNFWKSRQKESDISNQFNIY